MASGYNIEARFGFWFSQALRTDISYNYINGTYDWSTRFRTGTTPFKAHNQSNVYMANAYFHPGTWLSGNRSIFDPYFGGGLGVACNRLGIAQSNGLLLSGGSVDGTGTTNFAARGRAGILVPLSNCLNLDVNYSIMSLGSFATGSGLNVGSHHQIPFNGFDFGSNTNGSMNLALVFSR